MATVGVEPASIIESLKLYPCKKLILFADKRSKELTVPEVIKALKASKLLNIQTEDVRVEPYDILGTIDRFKKKIAENQGNPIILNVTGGRKTMAIAATLAGIVAGDKIRDIIYITEEEHKPVSLPRLLNPGALLTEEKRAILSMLAEKRVATAEEIQTGTKVKLQAIWKHLRGLEELGYVVASKGKPKKFELTPSGILLA